MKAQHFPYRLTTPILHWSTAAIDYLTPKWQPVSEYRRGMSWEDLRASTEEIFADAGLGKHMDDVHRGLQGQIQGIPRDHYMFTYKKEMPLKRRPDVC